MNAHSMAQKAYAGSTQTVKSPRAVEYEVIAKITHDLKSSAETKLTDYAKFAEAIHRNNLLWTTLASNVATSENALSAEVRAQLFYLGEFSHRHAAQVLAGKSSIDPLLEINTAVLRGLRQGGGM